MYLIEETKTKKDEIKGLREEKEEAIRLNFPE